MDDVLSANQTDLQNTLTHLNKIHPKITIVLEIESKSGSNFLDMSITKHINIVHNQVTIDKITKNKVLASLSTNLFISIRTSRFFKAGTYQMERVSNFYELNIWMKLL